MDVNYAPTSILRGGSGHPERFSLDPALKVGPGPFHAPSAKPLFGAIGDSAPDRWGRGLMRPAERRRAEQEGRAPRTVNQVHLDVGMRRFEAGQAATQEKKAEDKERVQ